MASCTSTNGLKNVYLMSLSYENISNESTGSLLAESARFQDIFLRLANSNNTIQGLRIGYMFMCLDLPNGAGLCSSDEKELAAVMELSGSNDPLNILQLAQSIRSEVFFYPLM